MTLIAMTLSEKPPIMTADILITSKTGEADMKLPNRPAPLSDDEVKHLPYKPHTFLQKLYIIQPNICLCAAGSVYAIKLILEDFRNFCRLKTNKGQQMLTREEVQDYFSNYDQDLLKDVVLGIAVALDDKSGFIFTPDIHKDDWEGGGSDDFGAVVASGSGASQFLEHIAWHHQYDSTHEEGDFTYVKKVIFTFITKLLAKESRTLKSLEDYWGGFLETCYFHENRFEKVGDIVFVICGATTDDEGNMSKPSPKLFIYSQYSDNVLYLTTVEATDFTVTSTDESIEYVSTTFTKTLFRVDEIDAKNPPDGLKPGDDLSFFTSKVAMGINVTITNQTHLPISAYAEGERESVEFVDGKYIKLIWPMDVHESHAAMVKHYYPQVKEAAEENG